MFKEASESKLSPSYWKRVNLRCEDELGDNLDFENLQYFQILEINCDILFKNVVILIQDLWKIISILHMYHVHAKLLKLLKIGLFTLGCCTSTLHSPIYWATCEDSECDVPSGIFWNVH